jgi:glucose/mannose transport system substrate-binding protein
MMTAMGDWAKGYLESEVGGGLLPDQDFGVVPFPGSVGTFVFTADTFGLPKGAVHRDGARSLLRTMASTEGQIAFNRLKGSIPARSDIASANFDAMTRRTIDDFQTGTRVKALSGILPRDAMSDMQTELRASLREASTSIIRRYLVHHYEVLR